MTSFVDAVTGNVTQASDVNQLVDALNGSTASQIFVKSTASSAQAIDGLLPSAPGSDQPTIRALVSGDSAARASLYIASTGYGGITTTHGSGTVYHLRGVSGGWTTGTSENLTVDGALTVNGAGTFAGATVSGGWTFNAGPTFNSDITLGSNVQLISSVDNNDFLGPQLYGSTDIGIGSTDHSISLSSGSGVWIKHNTYFDGTNDRYLTGSSGAVQFTTANTVGQMQMRFNTNSPSAGAVITWSSWLTLALFAGGMRLFAQTSDPGGSASDGDIWFDG